MPKPLTKEQCVKMIMLRLGGTVVDIELENDIGDIIDMSLLACKPYIGDTKLKTVPGSDHVDLEPLGVYTVVNIYKGDMGSITSASSGDGASVSSTSHSYDSYLFTPSLYNYYNEYTMGMSSIESYSISILTDQLINTVRGGTSDVDFWQDGNDLYVEITGVGLGGSMTLEYIPDYQDISEISEPFWINYILNIATAYTKIAIGRARTKYNISGLPYELDGDTILSEGTSELETLMEQLRDLSDIWYILD